MKSFNDYLEIIQEAKGKTKQKKRIAKNTSPRDMYTYYVDNVKKEGDFLNIFLDIANNSYTKVEILSADISTFVGFIERLEYTKEKILFSEKIGVDLSKNALGLLKKIHEGTRDTSNMLFSYISFSLKPTSNELVKITKGYSIELGTHSNGKNIRMKSKIFKSTIPELINEIKEHIKSNPVSWIITVNDEINDKDMFDQISDSIRNFLTNNNSIVDSVMFSLKGTEATFKYVKPNIPKGEMEESYKDFLKKIESDQYIGSIPRRNSMEKRR